MADFIDVQDQVLALIKASSGIPTVEEGALPAGLILPKQNGWHLPYALVSFGSNDPVAARHQGIAGSAIDLKWTSVAVECIGNSQRDARVAAQQIRKLLEGYIPDVSWGELTEVMSGDYTVRVPDYDLWPVRYAQAVVFNGYANAETP